jgi:hypothetical protein
MTLAEISIKLKLLCKPGLSILFEGKAAVYWTEESSWSTRSGDHRTTEYHTEHYTAEEPYFSVELKLLDNKGIQAVENLLKRGSDILKISDHMQLVGTVTDGDVTIQPGTTYYPFHFTLPTDLPSSFNGSVGKVVYLVTALMKRSWYTCDVKATLQFTVNGVLDLNKNPEAQLPLSAARDKYVCCCCCKSGPIGFKLNLPRRGFVPGEIVPFIAEMTNMSRRKVKGVTASIVQTVQYHAGGRTKANEFTIVMSQFGELAEGQSETWMKREGLRITPVPPTGLAGGCRIIDVQYELNVWECNMNNHSN